MLPTSLPTYMPTCLHTYLHALQIVYSRVKIQKSNLLCVIPRFVLTLPHRRREEDAANTDGGGGADDDNEHEGCDAAMKRMMKKLKTMRPEELAKLSKAASEMEKSKLEDKQKVAEFVGKTPELADLVDDCYICMEPLLNNIGTSKFGVLSWHCRCTVAQKAHSSCLLAKICRGDKCDMCSSPMMFESPRGTRNEATIKLFRKKKKSAHSARSARSARSSLDQDETSMFSGESSGPESFISADESGQDEQEDDGEGQEQEHEAEEEEEEELELELDDREEAEREEEPGEVEEEQEEQEQEEEEQEEAVPVYPNMNVYGEYVAARMRAVLEGSQERRAGGRYGEIDEVHDQPWFQQVRGVPREGEVRRGGRGRRR